MTEIALTTQRPSASAGASGLSRQTRLNDVLGWVLLVFVALVPIPFGSNRPFFWAVNAGLIGLAGIVYSACLLRLREPYRYGLARLAPSIILFLMVAAYLALQAIPLGWLLHFDQLAPYLAITTPQGATIAPTAISLAPGATWLMLLRWGTFGTFFFLVLQVAGSDRRRTLLLQGALTIATAYAIFGLASLVQLGDTILGAAKWAYEGSATGTFVNRNSFATFLAFGATLASSLVASTLSRTSQEKGEQARRRPVDPALILYVVALATIIPALLATQSRMGVFSAMGGCMVVFLAALARGPRFWLRALLMVPAVLLLAAMALYVYGQNLFERLGSTGVSADVRLELYRQVVEMIAARPWLGYGGGAFELAYPLFHQLPVSPDLVWDKAHNSYLALWAELGLVVGSIPLLLYLMMFARILYGMRRAGGSWAARAAGLGALTVAGLHSLVDFSLEIQADTIMLLFITAIAATGSARPIQTAR